SNGPKFWRSLDEVVESEDFKAHLAQEMPHWAANIGQSNLTRRNFMRLMGASMALAGLSGCNTILHPQPQEKIFPYAKQPEELLPGKPLQFATAMELGGFATGLLVESHYGRPIKVEGNPDHPASLGATDAITQASILNLYDPDRSQVVLRANRISSWTVFLEELERAMAPQRANRGAGLRLLTGTVTSPTLAHQIETLLTDLPLAKWFQYEPVSRDNVRAGAELAFGEVVQPQYHFDQAQVVLSLDADIFVSAPGAVRYARHFADKRRLDGEAGAEMPRYYAVESSPTPSGTLADHRLPLRAADIEAFARALAQGLGVAVEAADESGLAEHAAWLEAVVADLQQHQGQSLVVAGDYQSPAVHALAHAINDALGNVGQTVTYTEPVEANPTAQVEAVKELIDEMAAEQVDLLVMIGNNPVFDMPADYEFAQQLDKVKFRMHLGLHENETSERCQWHIPQTHYLEQWSDTRAVDGTVSVVQPLIAPLYEDHSAHEILAILSGQSGDDYAILESYWQDTLAADNFDTLWQTTIHDGLLADSALPAKNVSLQSTLNLPAPAPATGLELIFRPDPTIWDGQFVNNGWLQELPKPLTKLTWDNAALISPVTAERLGLANEDVVTLTVQGRSVEAPVWIMPGHADEAVTVHLGYGRTLTGQVGAGTGFNAYALRTSEAMWAATGLEVTKTGERYRLATTQHHHSMEGRDIVRATTLEELLHGEAGDEHAEGEPHQEGEGGHEEEAGGHGGEGHASIYNEEIHAYDGYAWGMTVDLANCNGCNACVTACQAENNIAVVGKDEVAIGREMHWIRIDRYYEGDLDNPAALNQPVLCMHCEQAPCEPVCPATATVHSHEGLNDMVYNRCIGTRYCSNNCPYKVRRFNFYQYQDTETPVLALMRNPDVTVRSRGVMEKCSYCVQRINGARIEAKKDERDIQDGEILTACQQACPTQAIVFGNINDPNSRVSKLKAQQRNYGLLTELNTQPRTTYLAKVTNPNPDLEA
ncbi:MAG: TAT-variant-translocated molybdopterin oxidoreductase, partial [Anaerolineae bacterium]|nr:TAT-variant-translocated molybdopterin oxidoreductase [Anaerolineae bacterium]